MEEKLLPCPFCGSFAGIVESEDESCASHDIVPYFEATCTGCNAQGFYSEDREEAVKQWNTRASSTEHSSAPPNREAVVRAAHEVVLHMYGGTNPDPRYVGQVSRIITEELSR